MTRLLLSILTAVLTVAITATPRERIAPPPAPLPQVEQQDRGEVGIFDRLRARRNPQIPAQWFVVGPQEAPQPAPAPVPVVPAKGINLKTGKPFPRGLTPTPRAILLAAPKFKPTVSAPAQYAVVPSKLSMWGNDTYGDCVTAEEAFKCACSGVFISESEVIHWAKSHGVLNGANLQPVIQSMQSKGFSQDGNLYNDGKESTVDYSNESVLRAAIAVGPVKLGMDANALPSGAGNQQGWWDFGGRPGEFDNEDHCTGLCGYGTAKFCFDSLHLPVPSGVDPAKPDCYLHFTWSTIGVVDHPWIMSTVGEAWVRNPSTVTVGTGTPTPDPPLDPPTPPTPPDPPDPPQPPAPTGGYTLTIPADLPPGSYTVGAGSLTPDEIAQLQALVAKLSGQSDLSLPPRGWVTDKRLTNAMTSAMEKKGGTALANYNRVAADPQAHPALMRMTYRHMQRDAEGRALLAQYHGAGPLPPGWLQSFLDWLIKNGPAIIDFIMQIMKLFGL